MSDRRLEPDLEAKFEALKTEARASSAPLGLALFRHTFAPAFLLLLVAPWLSGGAAVGLDALLTVVPFALLCTWMAEQLYPRERAWNVRLSDGVDGWRRLGRDLFYLLAITRLTGLLLGAVDPVLRSAMAAVSLPSIWPSSAPFAIRALLAFLVVELFAYWLHRAAHHSRILWQFHGTHHVLTELNALKAVRTHPIDNLLFHLARTAPLLLLGAGPQELAAALYTGAMLGILAHANLELSAGPLGLVMNLPRWHAVHHAAALEDSRSNYGCHTVLWDRVFGTFRAAPAHGGQLGVNPVGRRSLWRELVAPFYRWV